jgi:hypothetical protein
LACDLVFWLRAVGFIIVSTVLKGDAAPTFELFVIPLGYLRVREQSVMTTQEAGFIATSDAIRCRVIFACWVTCILPVTVLRLVDREPLIDVGVVSCDDKLGIVYISRYQVSVCLTCTS